MGFKDLTDDEKHQLYRLHLVELFHKSGLEVLRLHPQTKNNQPLQDVIEKCLDGDAFEQATASDLAHFVAVFSNALIGSLMLLDATVKKMFELEDALTLKASGPVN